MRKYVWNRFRYESHEFGLRTAPNPSKRLLTPLPESKRNNQAIMVTRRPVASLAQPAREGQGPVAGETTRPESSFEVDRQALSRMLRRFPPGIPRSTADASALGRDRAQG